MRKEWAVLRDLAVNPWTEARVTQYYVITKCFGCDGKRVGGAALKKGKIKHSRIKGIEHKKQTLRLELLWIELSVKFHSKIMTKDKGTAVNFPQDSCALCGR